MAEKSIGRGGDSERRRYFAHALTPIMAKSGCREPERITTKNAGDFMAILDAQPASGRDLKTGLTKHSHDDRFRQTLESVARVDPVSEVTQLPDEAPRVLSVAGRPITFEKHRGRLGRIASVPFGWMRRGILIFRFHPEEDGGNDRAGFGGRERLNSQEGVGVQPIGEWVGNCHELSNSRLGKGTQLPMAGNLGSIAPFAPSAIPNL